MRDDLNPYEPPTASLERPDPADVDARALALRRNNRGHEAAFRALGSVNFLGAVLDMAFIAVASAYTLTPDEVRSGVSSWGGTLWLVYLFIIIPAFVLLHVFIAIGLRHFWIWAFRGQVILSSASIVSFFKDWAIGWDNHAFPDFSIVTAVLSAIAQFAILYYLLASKARQIIAPGYRLAVAETRGLRVRRNWFLVVAIVPLSIASEWGLISATKDFTHVIGWPFR
jgi:hypothetical protein